MSKEICIICGKRKIPMGGSTIVREPHCYNLPHGKIHVHSGHCLTLLNGNINGAFPIMWTGFDDIVEHELLPKEITKTLSLEEEERVSQEISEYLWNGDPLGDMYSDALREGAKMAEKFYIDNLPQKKLHLHLHDRYEFDSSQKLFEQRLKGSK